MTVHIGITGTRNGWSKTQREGVYDQLHDVYDRGGRMFFHFGDCVGVDEQSFVMARKFGFITVSHPPTDPKLRAWCNADVVHHPRSYLERDQDIVDAVTLLIVVPSGPESDNPRSGTWATYRMAVKAWVETVVIMP